MPERLLDDDAPPLSVLFLDHVRRPEGGHDDAEEAIGDGEIEEMVARRAGRLVEPRKMLLETAVGLRVLEVALQVGHAVGQPSPGRLVDAVGLELAVTAGDEFVHHVGEGLAPVVHGPVAVVDADQPEAIGQPLGGHEIVERRRDQALGQIASGAEDHHGAGWRDGHRLGLRHSLGESVFTMASASSLPISLAPEHFQGRRDDLVGLEAELALQLLERRGGAERLHADDPALVADIALPTQRRCLLDGNAASSRRAAAPPRDRTAAGARRCPTRAWRRRASGSRWPPALHGPRRSARPRCRTR